MSPLRIKICGITRQDDALAAAACGVNAIGFVFCASPRRISINAAAAISRVLPKHVERIGVFADGSIADILSISDRTGLSGVQLNGNEDSDFARALKDERPYLTVIKTIAAKNEESFADIEDFASDLIILDSPRSEPSAKRKTLDIDLAQAHRPLRPFFIAGGLNPQNVAYYIKTLRPSGIDVSSGVESSPGIKDEDVIRTLILAARGGSTI